MGPCGPPAHRVGPDARRHLARHRGRPRPDGRKLCLVDRLQRSAFWVLLRLAAVTAGAGVVAVPVVAANNAQVAGVAIAISLVPPPVVVGLTLESGAPGQAAGAPLLFATEVAAIVATRTAVLIGYRIRSAAPGPGCRRVLVVLVTVPLGVGSYQALHTRPRTGG